MRLRDAPGLPLVLPRARGPGRRPLDAGPSRPRPRGQRHGHRRFRGRVPRRRSRRERRPAAGGRLHQVPEHRRRAGSRRAGRGAALRLPAALHHTSARQGWPEPHGRLDVRLRPLLRRGVDRLCPADLHDRAVRRALPRQRRRVRPARRGGVRPRHGPRAHRAHRDAGAGRRRPPPRAPPGHAMGRPPGRRVPDPGRRLPRLLLDVQPPLREHGLVGRWRSRRLDGGAVGDGQHLDHRPALDARHRVRPPGRRGRGRGRGPPGSGTGAGRPHRSDAAEASTGVRDDASTRVQGDAPTSAPIDVPS